MSAEDTNPSYWRRYTNLQKVKHDLIREYLNGWFPKLGFWAGRIAYLDTHAGRGRHLTGELGSPLMALKTLLGHKARDAILHRSEVRFFFIERDQENAQALEAEVLAVKPLPSRITYEIHVADCYPVLRDMIDWFREPGRSLAPAVLFVDPYGFKISGDVLRGIMSFPRVELFVNVIWRELDMAIHQPDRLGPTLDEIFADVDWRELIRSPEPVDRVHEAMTAFQEITHARWATYVRMLGRSQATRYILAHFTNHDAGRDLIKDCIWKICPDGGFLARASDDPGQEYLIEPRPDLSPLREWVLGELRKGTLRWKDLHERVRAKLWRIPQVNRVVRELRRDDVIAATDYEGSFGPGRNPVLSLKRDE